MLKCLLQGVPSGSNDTMEACLTAEIGATQVLFSYFIFSPFSLLLELWILFLKERPVMHIFFLSLLLVQPILSFRAQQFCTASLCLQSFVHKSDYDHQTGLLNI